MDIGELLQLMIFLGIAALSLAAGSRKKRRQRRQQGRSAPRPRTTGRPARPAAPPVSTEVRRRTAATAARPSPASATPKPRSLAQELLEMLEGRLPDTVPRPEPMPVAQPEVDDEAVSLETLEAAGTTSHERFHEKYMDQEPEPKPTSIRHRYGLTPRTAREAVIWATIFSKPKGML